jgi:anti-sigma factor RsiW
MTDLKRLAATMAGDPECPAHYARSVAEAVAEIEALRAGLERLARIYEDQQEPCERPAWVRDLLTPNAVFSGGGETERDGGANRPASAGTHS